MYVVLFNVPLIKDQENGLPVISFDQTYSSSQN
jgi:hypothetical protein